MESGRSGDVCQQCSRRREARIRGERARAELHDGDARDQKQQHVEEHRVHHCVADAHRVDGQAEEAQPELHVAFDDDLASPDACNEV